MEGEAPQGLSERQIFAAAASAVGIEIEQLSASETPWSTQHPRSQMWRAAIAHHYPDLAERYEVAHGGELSMALQLALDGHSELTPALASEWQTRRPAAYRAHQQRVVAGVMADLDRATEELRARNTPSWEVQQQRAAEAERARATSIAHTNALLGAQSRARGAW